MAYILEWRPVGVIPTPPGCGLVSYVRVFRTASAIKAFVRRRKLARESGTEFRLSLRRRGAVLGSVITGRQAILAWNDLQTSLPAALAVTRWGRELDRMTSLARVQSDIADALARAEAAQLLTAEQVSQLLRLVEKSLRAAS